MKSIILLLLIFFSSSVFGQLYESVEKEAERILISLSDGDSLDLSYFYELKNLLSSEIGIEVSESFPDVNQKSIDSLKNHFNEFESESKNISIDSALVLFNQWYLQLSNTFYNYADEKFFSSNKTKILFFSASISCYCTLEMCKKQTIEIIKLAKEKNLDYWIVDSYEHNDLQIKYETFFAPSVIVFNGNNELLYKIEYDEKMIERLAAFLDGYKD